MKGRVKGKGYICETIVVNEVPDGKDYVSLKKLWIEGKYREHLTKFFDSEADTNVNEQHLEMFLRHRKNVS